MPKRSMRQRHPRIRVTKIRGTDNYRVSGGPWEDVIVMHHGEETKKHAQEVAEARRRVIRKRAIRRRMSPEDRRDFTLR